MKNTSFISFFVVLLSVVSACHPQRGQQEAGDLNVNRRVSENYLPPVFEHDARVDKIRELEPAIRELIEDYSVSRHIPGVAYGIVVDNQLILASASGSGNIELDRPATIRSSFRIASMTKSFTAMAILKLRDEGKLSLTDPAATYIPEMAGLEYLTEDSPPITIANLLTMTAGFPEDNPWGDRQLEEPDQWLLDLITGGLSFSEPTSYGYEYSNTGYAILGHIISVVAGIPFQDYISENILVPLHMEHTYWEVDSVPEEQLVQGYRWEDDQWKTEPMLHDGSYGAMGGLVTSIEDFSKYVSFHLSAWPPRSDPDNGPVKRATLREMQTPQFCRLYAGATGWDDQPCAQMTGYGFGLRITEDCNGMTFAGHGGALPGFGSNYIFFPEYGIGLMAFCNLTYTSPWPLEEIVNIIFNQADVEKRSLPVSEILLERQMQVVDLIRDWDGETEHEILAENFFMDRSRDHRIAETREILERAGSILSVGAMHPENQLRGRFDLTAAHGKIHVFFTLTPEKDPKVQQLSLSYQPDNSTE